MACWVGGCAPKKLVDAARWMYAASGMKGNYQFEVWEENEEVFDIFSQLSTQWRSDSMTGRVLGLDYPGINAVLDMLAVTDKKTVFKDIRAMEVAVIKELNRGK